MEDIIVPDRNTPVHVLFGLTELEVRDAHRFYVIKRSHFHLEDAAKSLGISGSHLRAWLNRNGLSKKKLLEISFLFGYFAVTIFRAIIG